MLVFEQHCYGFDTFSGFKVSKPKKVHFVFTKPPLLRFSCKSGIFLHTRLGCCVRSLGARLGGVNFNDFMIDASNRFWAPRPPSGMLLDV